MDWVEFELTYQRLSIARTQAGAWPIYRSITPIDTFPAGGCVGTFICGRDFDIDFTASQRDVFRRWRFVFPVAPLLRHRSDVHIGHLIVQVRFVVVPDLI